MTDIKFVDTVPVSSTRMTDDGYLIADVRCARTGCQQYLARELGLDQDGVITVYRPENAVFSRDSLATFAGKPVTLDHPPVPVTADNWKEYAVGDVGTDIVRDGDFVRVHLKMMDKAAISQVQDSHKQISMGYTSPVLMVDGTAPDGTAYQAIQTGPIRINHLAVVRRARGGDELRIGDSAGPQNWGSAPLTMSDNKEVEMTVTLKTVVLGDNAAQVSTESAAVVEQFKANTAKQIADMETTHADALKVANAATAKAEAERDEAQKKILDAAAVDALVACRVELVDSVKKIAPKLETKGLADSDMKRQAVEAVRGKDSMKDRAPEYVDAVFDILVADSGKTPAAPVDPLRQALSTGLQTNDSTAGQDGKVFADYMADFNPHLKEA